MKNLSNPWIAVPVCMVLFAVMYNYADNDFQRYLSYVPLAVVLWVFLKGVYYAYFKRG